MADVIAIPDVPVSLPRPPAPTLSGVTGERTIEPISTVVWEAWRELLDEGEEKTEEVVDALWNGFSGVLWKAVKHCAAKTVEGAREAAKRAYTHFINNSDKYIYVIFAALVSVYLYMHILRAKYAFILRDFLSI